jgi:peptidoglycan/LPS O-acetylase OafA/YrhL
MSYSLYLTHFPLLALVWFAFFAPAQFPPGSAAYALFAGFLVAALAWASLVWWAFERQTGRARLAVEKLCARLTSFAPWSDVARKAR